MLEVGEKKSEVEGHKHTQESKNTDETRAQRRTNVEKDNQIYKQSVKQ